MASGDAPAPLGAALYVLVGADFARAAGEAADPAGGDATLGARVRRALGCLRASALNAADLLQTNGQEEAA